MLLLTGCASDSPGPAADPGPQGTSRPTSSGPAGAPSHGQALPPGPSVPSDAQIRSDELVITSNDPVADVDAAVRALDGELLTSDERIGVHVARFPVEDVPALLEVRDTLRRAGLDASVNPELTDPTTGG